ncbi:MAG: mycothiol-dependent maleylpyruvate isomerase [Humibacillus sp.]|nr:mycothiol-dependent maleylpyruvate isomerase [Humibacillus sp.]
MTTLTGRDVTTEHLAAETDRVVESAASLRNDAVLAPSLCAGWSRGHVLAHIARNADALSRVAAIALSGEPGTMYVSQAERDAEIEAGARRPAADQATDILESGHRLAGLLARLGPEHDAVTVERVPGGPRLEVGNLRFMRLRELVFHHVDLDSCFGFDRVAPEVVDLFLRDAVDRLRAADAPPSLTLVTTEGDQLVVGDGATAVRGTRADVLLWAARGRTDRVTLDGPAPTLPFGG